jgi:hypothetical protein
VIAAMANTEKVPKINPKPIELLITVSIISFIKYISYKN